MSASPKTYRVYCYDDAHTMVTADWLMAVSDEEAVDKAHAAGFGSKCEIWDGRRLVACLESERKQA